MLTERKAALYSSIAAIALTALVGVWLLTSERRDTARRIAAIDEQGRLAVAAVEEARERALDALRTHAPVVSGRCETTGTDWAELQADAQGVVILERDIRFERPFARAPSLAVGLSRLDVAADRRTGVNATAAAVTAEGFTLRISLQSTREIRAVDAFWVAHLPPVEAPPDAIPPGITDSEDGRG